ncbi:MAG: SDR family oxidoreductase [Mycobacterium sp.]|uniref:SDR family oxidoreductase n=1 Tax=Mycobacterium sp. TaxID=1785 RepID=UPI003F964E88
MTTAGRLAVSGALVTGGNRGIAVHLHTLYPASKAAVSAMVGRLAEPDEIASVVAFLLSPDACYITGATLDAAGGWI